MKNPLVPIVLILTVGLAAYSNTFHGPFQYDEVRHIISNPVIRDLSLPSAAVRGDMELYKFVRQRPVGVFSFAVNYRLHGTSVEGYHIVNLLIHLAAAVLVFVLVRLVLLSPALGPSVLRNHGTMLAFLASLFFVAHPVQTQAVTYVHQRFASLAAFFYLLAVVLYARWRFGARPGERQPAGPETVHPALRWSWYAAALLSTVLAMKTKENAFTLPIMLTVLEFFFFSGTVRQRLRFLAPFLLTLVIIPMATYDLLAESGRRVGELTVPAGEMPREAYFLTQFRVIMTYLRLLVLPVGQNVDYDYPVMTPILSWPLAASLLAVLAMLGGAVFLFLRSRRADPGLRLVSFGILWFFVTLSVESSIIPLPNPIDEQRLYLPSAGLFLAAVSGAAMLLVLRSASRTVLSAAAVAAVAAALVFALAAYRRNALWQDNVLLWEDIVSKSPRKVGPRVNLGKFYDQAGRYDDAVREFRKALELVPGYPNARRNLIITLIHQGRFGEADREFRNSLGPGVDPAAGHFYLAGLLLEEGMTDEAVVSLRSALRLNPRYLEARRQLAQVHARRGEWDDAVRELETAVALDRSSAVAYYDLGSLYAEIGRFDDAAKALRTVVSLDPQHAEAWNNLGGVYVELGRFRDAIACLEEALRLRPDADDIRYNLQIVKEQLAGGGPAR